MVEPATERFVVSTIGMHASASTWVFNVVRELAIDAFGQAGVHAFFTDAADRAFDEAARDGRRLVIKSHHGDLALDAWLTSVQARIVLSLRDPRDASVSMAKRFSVPLNQTARWIAVDCNRLVRLASVGHPLFRYEDRFFEHRDSVVRLADFLRLKPTSARVETIFERYSTDAVRTFAGSLATLPPERLGIVGTWNMDRETQIHAPHIGDARSGKWRELPDATQAELTRFFRPFLARFGYSV